MEKTFLKSDLEFIQRIQNQGGTTDADDRHILTLYNMYIETNYTCPTCRGVQDLWEILKPFIYQNSKLFIN